MGLAGWGVYLLLGRGGEVTLNEDAVFFGKVPRGEPVSRRVLLRNSTPHAIRIEEVQSSCTCALGLVENDIVPAGGQLPLNVTLTTHDLYGDVQRDIVVRFEKDSQPPLRLRVYASIYFDQPSLTSNCVYFGFIGKDDAATSGVRIFSQPDDPTLRWKVQRAVCDNLAVSTKVGPDHEEIICSLTGKATPGPLTGNVFLDVVQGGKRFVPVRLPIVGIVHSRVYAAPAMIYLGVQPPRTAVDAYVRLFGIEDPAKVLRANGRLLTLRDDLKAMNAENGIGFSFHVMTPSIAGGFKGLQAIRTGNRDEQAIEIGVAGWVVNDDQRTSRATLQGG
jgi:Protein of unknown function (DUF1573)